MGINGVPLHPLVVHAAVVFTPLAALAVISFFVVRRWRAWLRLPTLAVVVVCGLSIVAAYLTGKNFLNHNPQLAQNPLVLRHEHRGAQLLVVGIVFAVVAVVAVLLAAVPAPAGSTTGDRKAVQPALAIGTAVLAVLLALAVLVLVIIAGDLAGRAVWGGLKV
jgi:hypothetical protein